MIGLPLLKALAAACAATYQPPQAPLFTGRNDRVHVYLSMIDGVHCFAHEGTTSWLNRSSADEWLIDFDAVPLLTSSYGRVHEGILLDVDSVATQIADYLHTLGWPPFYLTGHSKGAGEVTIEAAYLKLLGHKPLAVAAFEPPQVGGHALRDYLGDVDYAWTCTVNAEGRDIATRVPEGLQLPYLTEWSHVNDPLLLTVPDWCDVAAKHRIKAVQDGLDALHFEDGNVLHPSDVKIT